MRSALGLALTLSLVAAPGRSRADVAKSIDARVQAMLDEARAFNRPGGANAPAGAWASQHAIGHYEGTVQGRVKAFRLSLFGAKRFSRQELALRRDGETLSFFEKSTDQKGRVEYGEASGRILESKELWPGGDTLIRVRFDRYADASRQARDIERDKGQRIPVVGATDDVTLRFRADGTLATATKSALTRGQIEVRDSPATSALSNALIRTTIHTTSKGELEPVPPGR
jgi:hypothetical protein